MSKDRYERRHRRTARNPEAVKVMAEANFDAVPSLAEAMGLTPTTKGTLTMKNCPECHHLPSGRFDGNGCQCHCNCHDVADHAPELLAALESIASLEPGSRGAYSKFTQAKEIACSAIAQTKGGAG